MRPTNTSSRFLSPLVLLSMSQVDRLQQFGSVFLELQILRHNRHVHGLKAQQTCAFSFLAARPRCFDSSTSRGNARLKGLLVYEKPAWVSLSRELASLKRGLGLANVWLPSL